MENNNIMKKISLKELQDLVANVDYLLNESYPIAFTVINGNNKLNYEVGIGQWEEDNGIDDWNEIIETVFPCSEGIQYLCLMETNTDNVFSFLDTQDADDMVYDEINDMLKRKCNITDDTEIYLDEDNSFNGNERTIYEDEISQILRKEIEEKNTMINYDEVCNLLEKS